VLKGFFFSFCVAALLSGRPERSDILISLTIAKLIHRIGGVRRNFIGHSVIIGRILLTKNSILEVFFLESQNITESTSTKIEKNQPAKLFSMPF